MNDFSILICVYQKDNPVLFNLALDSIFNNTLNPKEVILVVDGPVPSSIKSVYESFPKLKVILLQENIGLASALNVGINYINTKYFFRCDSDDINELNRFEIMFPYLLSGYTIVGSNIDEYDSNKFFLHTRTVPSTLNKIRRQIIFRCPFNHMTVGLETNSVKAVGGYPLVHLKEDYALWIILLANKFNTAINLQISTVRVTAGMDLYKRRGGWRYALSEIAIQNLLIKHGYTNIFFATIVGFMRVFVTLLPNFFRAFIYINFLRK